MLFNVADGDWLSGGRETQRHGEKTYSQLQQHTITIVDKMKRRRKGRGEEEDTSYTST